MKAYRTLLLFLSSLAILSLAGCNRFLDQNPDDRTQINSSTAAKELAVTAYNEYSYVPLFEFRSDNVADKGTRTQMNNNFDRNMYQFDETVPSTYQDSPQGFWRASYTAIAAANQVLYDLERIGANDETAMQTRGEALIARAYAMYMLAQAFTIPYDPATANQDLGLPYPTEPETVLIKEYKRGTLQATYDKIASDFEEGYKLVGDNYPAPKFHFTRQASAAFGTRLYRTLHNWDRVIELGEVALGNNPALYTRKVNDPKSHYQGTYQERENVWSLETENCNFLIGVHISSWSRAFYLRYGLNQKLRDFFNKNNVGDNFLGTAPGTTFFGNVDYYNVPKIKEHFKVVNQSTGTGYVYTQTVMLDGDEVLFNLAEAYAMKNQFEKTEELLQLFVTNFMDGYSPDDDRFKVTREKMENYYKDRIGKILPDPVHGIEINSFNPSFSYTPEQEMYLRACVDLKRFVYIHEGMRWMDNRHFRMDIVHNVFSAGNATEEFIVLRGNNPRYAYQLPENVLSYIEKNPGYEAALEVITK